MDVLLIPGKTVIAFEPLHLVRCSLTGTYERGACSLLHVAHRTQALQRAIRVGALTDSLSASWRVAHCADRTTTAIQCCHTAHFCRAKSFACQETRHGVGVFPRREKLVQAEVFSALASSVDAPSSFSKRSSSAAWSGWMMRRARVISMNSALSTSHDAQRGTDPSGALPA
jgi:hypothetical protein